MEVISYFTICIGGRRGRDRIVVGFSTTYAISVKTVMGMVWFRVMMFNAIFNNISAILWRSVLLVEETEVPGENQTIDQIGTKCKYMHMFLSTIV
jgi:hypothetical protein